MPPANAKLLSQEIEHALMAAGASNRLARQVAAALARYDQQTLDLLAAGIAKAVAARNQRVAVESLLAAFARLNLKAVAEAFRTLMRAMKALAAVEVDYFVRLLSGATGAAISSPAAKLLAEGVERALVLGESLAEQEARFAAFRYREVAKAVREGVLGGSNTDEVLAALKDKGGPFGKAAEAIQNVSRTDAWMARNVGRNHVYRQNPGAAIGQFWSSVLDSLTTPVCRANDGATRTLTPDQIVEWEEKGFAAIAGEDAEGPFDGIPWSNGYKGPYPAHYGERSEIVPLVNRAAPDKLTFEEWFNSKSATEQERLLGPSRFALWKSGRFSLRDFVNDRGRTLTLAELRAKDRAAFDAAVDEAESA